MIPLAELLAELLRQLPADRIEVLPASESVEVRLYFARAAAPASATIPSPAAEPPAAAMPPSRRRRETCAGQILRLLQESGQRLTTAELVERSHQQTVPCSESTISHTLAVLKRSGEVIHPGDRGGYALPAADA